MAATVLPWLARRPLLAVSIVALVAALLAEGMLLAETRDWATRALADRGLTPSVAVGFPWVRIGPLALGHDGEPRQLPGLWVAGQAAAAAPADESFLACQGASLSPSWSGLWARPGLRDVHLLSPVLHLDDAARMGTLTSLVARWLTSPRLRSSRLEVEAGQVRWSEDGLSQLSAVLAAGAGGSWTGRGVGVLDSGDEARVACNASVKTRAGAEHLVMHCRLDSEGRLLYMVKIAGPPDSPRIHVQPVQAGDASGSGP